MIAQCLVMISLMTSLDDPRPAKLSIRTDLDGKPQAVEVVGIDTANLKKLTEVEWDSAQWSSLFFVAAGRKKKHVQVPGSYRVVGEVLRFEPKYPFDPDLNHLAFIRHDRLPIPGARDVTDITFTAPKPKKQEASTIVRVDPSGDRVPENLLKFYIHFSQPMSRGEAYKRVSLIDSEGKKLELPFLEIGEELWDPSGTRITMLLDPGRVKRGLKPREEEGPILEEGKKYTLVVDANWPDANGQPLKEGVRKTFEVGPPVEVRLDAKTWKITTPEVGTINPLIVTFPRSLDRALLDRALEVLDPRGRPLAGTISVDHFDSRWQFQPEKPWEAGVHEIHVDSLLEDLAGNSLARAFEVDLLHPVGEPEARPVILPFTIASPRGK